MKTETINSLLRDIRMNDFETERSNFEIDVKNRAAVLVRDGYAAPFDAIDMARRQIMAERKAAAQVRKHGELNNLLGGVGKN